MLASLKRQQQEEQENSPSPSPRCGDNENVSKPGKIKEAKNHNQQRDDFEPSDEGDSFKPVNSMDYLFNKLFMNKRTNNLIFPKHFFQDLITAHRKVTTFQRSKTTVLSRPIALKSTFTTMTVIRTIQVIMQQYVAVVVLLLFWRKAFKFFFVLLR